MIFKIEHNKPLIKTTSKNVFTIMKMIKVFQLLFDDKSSLSDHKNSFTVEIRLKLCSKVGLHLK